MGNYLVNRTDRFEDWYVCTAELANCMSLEQAIDGLVAEITAVLEDPKQSTGLSTYLINDLGYNAENDDYSDCEVGILLEVTQDEDDSDVLDSLVSVWLPFDLDTLRFGGGQITHARFDMVSGELISIISKAASRSE